MGCVYCGKNLNEFIQEPVNQDGDMACDAECKTRYEKQRDIEMNAITRMSHAEFEKYIKVDTYLGFLKSRTSQ